jgi:hypothetical protein
MLPNRKIKKNGLMSFWMDQNRSKNEYVAAMRRFYESNSTNTLEKYATRFYENIETIFKTKHRDYAEVFMEYLVPIDLARDEDKENLLAILERTDKSNTHFIKLLKLKIESVERMILMRNQ